MAEAKLKEKPDEENVKEALNATVEILSDNMDTDGRYVTNRKVGDGTLIWIPGDGLETEPYNPNGEEEIESAIEECIGGPGSWSYEWAESIVGSDAPEDIIEKTQRELCEGLYEG